MFWTINFQKIGQERRKKWLNLFKKGDIQNKK